MIYDNKNDTSNEVTKNIMWQKNLWEVEIFYDSMHLQSYSELVSVTCEKGCYDDVNNNLINSDEYHEEKYPLFYTSSEHPREISFYIIWWY